MKLIVLLLCLPLLNITEASAQTARIPDSGTFAIISQQQRVGTEKFRIAFTASGAEATGELDVQAAGSGGKVSETSELKMDSALKPLSYQRTQKAPKKGSIAVEFSAKQTKLVAKGEQINGDELFFLPENVVVLDTNFFHHYAVLLRQYRPEQAGPQTFNVFIPQEATPGTITLELKGKENVTVGNAARELNRFEASTEEVKMDIWVAPDGQIFRIAIPQASLEVVRQ